MLVVSCVRVFFFFKQKTAYEMRISDWSSDVCSSDLAGLQYRQQANHHLQAAIDAHRDAVVRFHAEPAQVVRQAVGGGVELVETQLLAFVLDGDRVGRSSPLLLDPVLDATVAWLFDQLGRASCRERVCQ